MNVAETFIVLCNGYFQEHNYAKRISDRSIVTDPLTMNKSLDQTHLIDP